MSVFPKTHELVCIEELHPAGKHCAAANHDVDWRYHLSLKLADICRLGKTHVDGWRAGGKANPDQCGCGDVLPADLSHWQVGHVVRRAVLLGNGAFEGG